VAVVFIYLRLLRGPGGVSKQVRVGVAWQRRVARRGVAWACTEGKQKHSELL